jgi:hypothetical protein
VVIVVAVVQVMSKVVVVYNDLVSNSGDAMMMK